MVIMIMVMMVIMTMVTILHIRMAGEESPSSKFLFCWVGHSLDSDDDDDIDDDHGDGGDGDADGAMLTCQWDKHAHKVGLGDQVLGGHSILPKKSGQFDVVALPLAMMMITVMTWAKDKVMLALLSTAKSLKLISNGVVYM